MSFKNSSIVEVVDVSRRNPQISDEARRIFSWVCYGVVVQLLAVFGTVTNTINIICFIKQGFKDPVNVSLLGLAISDLGSLVPLFFTNICLLPPVQEADLPFDPVDVQHLTTGWLHVMFTRVTSWITALITMERCLCITMPLKVNSMITPERVTAVIICVFVVIICGNIPMYYANRLDLKYSPVRNKTIIGLVFTADRAIVETVAYAINNVFIPFSAFVTVITCTITLVISLKKKSKWGWNVARRRKMTPRLIVIRECREWWS